MTYVVNLEQRAQLQVMAIIVWWEQHRLENPHLFEKEVRDLLLSLAEMPYRGVALPRTRPRSRTRWLVTPTTGYRVTYAIDDGRRAVTVLRVVHRRRR
jgi:plasmid stabilization system protein ParE